MSQTPRLPATKLLLALLARTGEASIDFYTFLHDLRYHRGTYMRGGHELVQELKRLGEAKQAQRVLDRLHQARYLKAHEIGNRLIVTLTKKGLAAALAVQLHQAPRRADKLCTVVIFDIPETERGARRQFRLLLRQGGFTKLQQSVWVSRGDTHELVTKFVKQAALEAWVNVFLATSFLHLPR